MTLREMAENVALEALGHCAACGILMDECGDCRRRKTSIADAIERVAKAFAEKAIRVAIKVDRQSHDVRHIHKGRALTGPEIVVEAIAAAERGE